MTTAPSLLVDHDTARRVLLLRAYETTDTPEWSADDRAWATRMARASLGDGAAPAVFLDERARHAFERLRPKERALGAWLAGARRLGGWVVLAALVGFGLGLAADQIGAGHYVNLLAPPVWVVVTWNLLVYLLTAVHALLPRAAGGVKRWIGRLGSPPRPRGGPLAAFAVEWAERSAPLQAARAAVLLHVAAALLAVGLAAGLYLRGLVFDYRAGWQSTFLGPEQVQQVLRTALAPASAVTGIALPDAPAMAALQVTPAHPAQASAAPWLHLYAATLGLLVVLPRLVLAALAGGALTWRQRRFALPVHEPYFQQLLRQAGHRGASGVQIVPHALELSASAALALRQPLAALLGESFDLQLAPVLPYGDEDQAAARVALPAGCGWRIVATDFGATPEAEVHGRLVKALQAQDASVRVLLLADERAFVERFGATSPRRAERRAAWAALADSLGVPLVTAPLAADDAAERSAMQHALERALGR